MSVDLYTLLSTDKFRCLDFVDVALLDKAQCQAAAKIMDELLLTFLGALGYQHVIQPKDAAFRKDFWAWGQRELVSILPDKARRDALLDTAASSMEFFYPNSSHQLKMCVGAITAVCVIADDLIADPGAFDQFDGFSQRFLRGIPQPEGICAALAEAIKDIDELFGSVNPRLGSYGVMSWLNGIDAFCQEARFAKELPGQLDGHRFSKGHVQWRAHRLSQRLRTAAGLADAYVLPIFNLSVPLDIWFAGIPDLLDYTTLINDLLSFPKEVLDRENYNYLSLTTRAKSQAGQSSHFGTNDGLWTFRDTLFEAFDETLTHTADLDGLFVKFADALAQELEDAQAEAKVDGLAGEEAEMKLKKNKEELENARLAANLWTDYRHGFPAWHIYTPRYRLDSLRATVNKNLNAKQNGTGA